MVVTRGKLKIKKRKKSAKVGGGGSNDNVYTEVHEIPSTVHKLTWDGWVHTLTRPHLNYVYRLCSGIVGYAVFPFIDAENV
jgi:hypothetical protein